jgi:hypothetical protein
VNRRCGETCVRAGLGSNSKAVHVCMLAINKLATESIHGLIWGT